MERHTPTSSVNGDCYYDGESSYRGTDVCDYDQNMLPELLASQIDSALQGLDMERTRAAMAVSTVAITFKNVLWSTCIWECS